MNERKIVFFFKQPQSQTSGLTIKKSDKYLGNTPGHQFQLRSFFRGLWASTSSQTRMTDKITYNSFSFNCAISLNMSRCGGGGG
jgi:hypothetical protein